MFLPMSFHSPYVHEPAVDSTVSFRKKMSLPVCGMYICKRYTHKLWFFSGAGYRSRTFSGSNPSSANFFRLLCSVYLPQKVRGIFGLKAQKTGPGTVSTTIPKPVLSDFAAFRAVSALKARKLPDLSGRQIRQSICKATHILIEDFEGGSLLKKGGSPATKGVHHYG